MADVVITFVLTIWTAVNQQQNQPVLQGSRKMKPWLFTQVGLSVQIRLKKKINQNILTSQKNGNIILEIFVFHCLLCVLVLAGVELSAFRVAGMESMLWICDQNRVNITALF